ncbi:MAG TPA: GAF domain-containing protein [Miltoncostaeaceae bacterium]|nr:GAF domain-containing protein [Miltoncostaeaceae bacterium]
MDLALDAADLGAFVWHAETGSLRWSERLERMAGLGPGTFGGRLEDFIALVHPDDRERLRSRTLHPPPEGDVGTEYRLVRPDGEVRWLWGNGRVVRDAAGAVTGMTGVVLDITDRRRAETALRASEERFRLMADSAPALVWVSEPSGGCTYFNRAWLEFTGRTMDQELGNGWADGIHPDDLERCLAIYRDALRRQEPFETEYRLRDRHGAYRWILGRGSPMGGGARFTGMVGICIDIHDRRRDWERRAVLPDVAAVLDAQVGIEDRLPALAGLLVERLGDLCLVEVSDDGARTVACAARSPDGEGVAHRVRHLGPVAAQDRRRLAAASESGAILVGDVAAGPLDALMEDAGLDEATEGAMRARPPCSAIVAPLTAGGRALGWITLTAHGERRLDEADRALVEDVGRRAALALDIARSHAQAHETAERLGLLQEATAALSSAAGPEEVGEVAQVQGRTLLRAAAATVYEVEGAELAVLASDGRTGDIGTWARVPLAIRAPVTDAARERRAVWVDGAEAWRAHYPDLAAEAERRGIAGAAALPLVAGDAVVGVIALTFEGDRSAPEADRDPAMVFAEACGQALARARLRRDAEFERGRAMLLAEVSLALDAETGVEERLKRLAELLVPTLADLAKVRLVGERGGSSRLAALACVNAEKEALARNLYGPLSTPADRAGPERVMATGRAELVSDAAEEMSRAPAPDPGFADGLRRLEVGSYMSLPLTARGAVLGALTLMATAESGRRYGEADLALAGEVARRAALAVDNARIYEAEQAARDAAERARGRAERLQRVTAALAAALTQDEVARVVVEGAMESLSAVAGAVVLRRGDEGEVILASGYPDDLLRAGLRFPANGSFPLAAVLRTGEELWLETAEDWTSRFGEPREELSAAGLGLPLRIGGEVVGAIGFRFGQDDRAFSAGDRLLARTLASQCALALERARLYESERHAAEVLQRALLPAGLPPPAAARLDVRYLPAAGGRSGGDFYDALELGDGRLSLVVGDVVGHGMEAAAVMGQLRSAWRAFALDGDAPAPLVGRLSRFAERVEGAAVATVACAVLDGVELAYVCAGHPPPILRPPGGPAEYLMDGRGPPLGVYDQAYREGRVTLAADSLVLLYTDGMIERDRDIERGMRNLAALVGEGPADPRALLARLAEEVGPDPADDCALLALLLTAGRAPLRMELPAEPTALSAAREEMRRWLADAGFDRSQAADVVLAASEALANSAEHAYAPGDPPSRARVSVELAWEPPDALTVVVRDRGRWRPTREASAWRGRGLPLMRALMETVDVAGGDHGTVVRMQRRIGRGEERSAAVSPSAAAAPDAWLDERPGSPMLRVEGELDDVAASALAERVAALDRPVGRVVLDLTDARYLGSAGVRALVEVADRLDGAGRRLEVVAPPGTIARRVLDLSGVAATLDVADGPRASA